MKCDIKIYGIKERSENILKNKDILGLTDKDIFIKNSGEDPRFGKWPYKLMKHVFKQSIPEGITHRLVLQDDNELCPNFLEYLNQIVNARPDDIFMLTALDYMKESYYANELKSPYIKLSHQTGGNAIIIPVKYINDMFTWMDKTYPNIVTGNPHEDAAVVMYARMHNINITTTIPSIVQHIGDTSTICDYDFIQRTAYFKNWEKADYTNSYLNETKEKYEFQRGLNTNNKVKYFVRTTGEREFNYSPLQYGCIYDYIHQPVDSFIKALNMINDYDVVLLEDDLILCKNFQEEIEKVIAKRPNMIINFFTEPDVWETPTIRDNPFEWNQCTYYPKGTGKIIAQKMQSVRRKFPKDHKLYSQIESIALYNLCMPHYIHRPILVQHNDINSILKSNEIINTKDKIRNTPYFKDYLDELGIDYNEAYKAENKKKLKDLRDKHFDEIIKKAKNS